MALETEIQIGSVRLPVNAGNSSGFIPGEQTYVMPAQGYLEKLAYGVAHNLPVLLIG